MLIALTGPAGCGKTTAARYLIERHDFVRVRFADPLKRMLGALGLSSEQIDGAEKESPCDLLCGQTSRWAQQYLGTEWGRECIDEGLWVHHWRLACDEAVGRNIVVDDCRFPNEVSAIRDDGGFVIRIDGRGGDIGDDHISERAITAPMLSIGNAGSVEQFHERLDALLCDLSWTDFARARR